MEAPLFSRDCVWFSDISGAYQRIFCAEDTPTDVAIDEEVERAEEESRKRTLGI